MNKLFNIHKFCILNKINYAGSITHREAPKVSNSDDNYGEKVDTLVDKMGMREYKFDEQFYNEIVKDSKFSFGKFNEINYPLHLQQQ